MRKLILTSVISVLLLIGTAPVYAQDEEPVVSPASEAAENLDLQAVCELFKDAESLKDFEKSLNDPEVGINNLDLDGNGEVDFIRVVEEAADETHVVILQVPVTEDEYQDVATIEIERAGEDEYNVQAHGNEIIYGPNYYVYPPMVRVHLWPILPRLYRPGYRPYVSVYRFGYYPRWWRPRAPVRVHIYRNRIVNVRGSATYRVVRTSRVKTVHRVRYTPRNSPRVKKTIVIRTKPARRKAVRKKRKR